MSVAAVAETCPLCQSSFDPACANCASSCPMASSCSVLTCPSCGYSYPRPTGLSALLARFFARRSHAHTHDMTLADAGTGQRLRVVSLGKGAHERLARLAAFGIAEGCELTLRQRHPALVVEVGETTLALDAALAREVRVVAAALK